MSYHNVLRLVFVIDVSNAINGGAIEINMSSIVTTHPTIVSSNFKDTFTEVFLRYM